MPDLVGAGILHTKLMVNNASKDFYVGSANMDWRSLTLVKEMGLHFETCPTATEDILKIFQSYYLVAFTGAKIPSQWPASLATVYNKESPLNIKLSGIDSQMYFSVSPPEFQTQGRTGDLDAILHIMDSAKTFIYVAVMDFVPGYLYTYNFEYWPVINDKLLTLAIDRNIQVRLLISKWQYTRYEESVFLTSLYNTHNISSIEIRLFQFPKPIGEHHLQLKLVFLHLKHLLFCQALISTTLW